METKESTLVINHYMKFRNQDFANGICYKLSSSCSHNEKLNVLYLSSSISLEQYKNPSKRLLTLSLVLEILTRVNDSLDHFCKRCRPVNIILASRTFYICNLINLSYVLPEDEVKLTEEESTVYKAINVMAVKLRHKRCKLHAKPIPLKEELSGTMQHYGSAEYECAIHSSKPLVPNSIKFVNGSIDISALPACDA